MVPLGRVLTHRKEFIEINDLENYKRCRAQLHAQGIVLRDIVPGLEIKTKKQQVCRAGEFLVAEIDAKLGGYGIVPRELEGAIVSSHYFLFGIDETKLDRSFLGYFIRTPDFHEQVAAQGSTNYAAIRPAHVLEYQIPLPPLAEQRRLVERIDALAAKIEEAKRLRREANHAAGALMAAHTLNIFEEMAKSHTIRKLSEFEPHVTSGPRNWGQRTVDSGDRFYRAHDILPFGRLAATGKVFIESPNTSQGMGAMLKPGDLMIVITGATVGRLAVYPADNEPGYVSQHVAICRIDPAHLDPRFALQGLLSPYGQEQILGQRYGQGKPGLNLTNIGNLRLPVPPLAMQKRVVEYLGHLEERIRHLTSQQAGSEQGVESLLPAILDRAFRGEL
jgi:type I restriction enzyme S subunit